MAILSDSFIITTKGFDDVIDITQKVSNVVANLNVQKALTNITVLSSCASIITIDDEPGIAFDVSKMLSMIAPINKVYQHDNIWHEGNAYAHLRATILGNSLTIPVYDNKIVLDELQRIVLIDFDNKPRSRKIIVSVVY